jgi:hypothetical protein
MASAAGLNIHWNSCTLGGGVQNMNSLCNDDFLDFVAPGQFRMPSGLSGVTGIEFTLDLASASPALPAWWQYNNGECRATELSFNAVAPSGVGCPDWAGGTAQGGLAAYNEGAFGPNTAHILGGFAVATARNITNLTQDFFAFNMKILGDNTTTGGSSGIACGGCDVAVCIVFNGVKVVTPTTFIKISGPQSPGSDFITWQGGLGTGTILGTTCPQATPTHKSTWGAVKSLYR